MDLQMTVWVCKGEVGNQVMKFNVTWKGGGSWEEREVRLVAAGVRGWRKVGNLLFKKLPDIRSCGSLGTILRRQPLKVGLFPMN